MKGEMEVARDENVVEEKESRSQGSNLVEQDAIGSNKDMRPLRKGERGK